MRVDDDQEIPRVAEAEGHESLLARGLGIFSRKSEGIGKNRCGLGEAHVVPSLVCRRLGGVPFIPHRQECIDICPLWQSLNTCQASGEREPALPRPEPLSSILRNGSKRRSGVRAGMAAQVLVLWSGTEGRSRGQGPRRLHLLQPLFHRGHTQ